MNQNYQFFIIKSEKVGLKSIIMFLKLLLITQIIYRMSIKISMSTIQERKVLIVHDNI